MFKIVLPIGSPTVICQDPLPWYMADDKQGRDEQADDEKRRQRERMQEEARTRADEEQPMRVDPNEQLGDLDEALKSHDYPATTNELVEAYGDYELETQDGKKSLEDVLSSTDVQIFDSGEDVHRRILELIDQ
ncbi:hypothetical protein HLASF_0507 [Halanaeroarchaeum sulfurireducens]|uniref:Uncharacterized protein n=2 Tax=Halanaeroarchaeum sulfurireducens TaxID=1604004 RepID=A0A0F7P722_9EURY|nr:hypothetical protein HLASF_0507 [Halanaeroarchaeum sulfurireducens]ALG81407.1 hypothetical protein HLASA_0504 [Halanaeroarchaeum sulfurireducens]